MNQKLALALFSAVLLFAGILHSQSLDSITADPQHYKVQRSLGDTRVLRATFGPHDKSRLLSEPERLVVCLSFVNLRLTREDGVHDEFMCKVGAVLRLPAGTHRIENLGDDPAEFLTIQVDKTTQPAIKRNPV